ncbi:MAG: hypothetical protein GTO51_11250 [Candidatus Latescibacteria bacterium]|nr:hypothetical protein [Candidatus Latescibacterota bacterium]NIM66540.1 hypothetical protein [Candidatus Latescibacterota bacterium]NIO03021.1 hypothetical protein [Candidatus Latescibacterota bacterium]NIO30157.1 hypothetical protein [Candidatus Latescibacterota bacterium]NIO57774.1 hypothetical protein [Candidatus Latescibacterota bacterium]
MSFHRVLIVTLIISLVMPSVLSAQAARNAKEALANESQIAVDKLQIVRDREEIKEFEALLEAMDQLEAVYAGEDFRKINMKLRVAMQREFEQAKGKFAQTRREARQSRREARGEWQEARMTGNARDRVQARDDRRDLRDDRRDREAAKIRTERMRVILSETKALQSELDRGSGVALAINRALLGEFLRLLQEDLEATESELKEDRRERREDRRERRTDQNK